MTIHKSLRTTKAHLLIIIAAAFLIGCKKESNLLSVELKNTNTVETDDYNRKLANLSNKTQQEANIVLILSQLWSYTNTENTAVSVRKSNGEKHDTYQAIVIFDNIPDDDSVSGYRYDIEIHHTTQGNWHVNEVKESWRCWEDRGHRHFGIAPCS